MGWCQGASPATLTCVCREGCCQSITEGINYASFIDGAASLGAVSFGVTSSPAPACASSPPPPPGAGEEMMEGGHGIALQAMQEMKALISR